MGWNQLLAWRKEMRRSLQARHGLSVTGPDSWDGAESDGWWEQMRRKGREGG